MSLNRIIKQITEQLSRASKSGKSATLSPSIPTPDHENASDPDQLTIIAALAEDEISLIRDVLDIRYSGEHVSEAQVAKLRHAHRRGLAARQCCADGRLKVELGWLQAYGSLALMTDVDELDRDQFERDLEHRRIELHRALTLHKTRTKESDR